MKFLTSCLKVCDEAKDKGGSANLLSGIADLQLQIGQVNESIESLEEALDIYKQLGNYFAQAGELDILAKVYTKLGKKKTADDYKKESEKIQVEKGFELEVRKQGQCSQGRRCRRSEPSG